MEKRVYGVEL